MSTGAIGEAPLLARVGSRIAAPKKRWLTLRRVLLLVVGLLVPAVALASVAWYRRAHPPEPPFRTVEVTEVDIAQRVSATGTLQPVITSPVGAQVSGIVWKLHADFNSTVKAGDIMVELDPALFRNSIALASAQLAQAEANLSSTQATALGARMAETRTKSLEANGLASNADLDAIVALSGQSAALTRTSAAQIAAARAQLARAELDLQHSVIRSPVNGTVISRNVDVGQAVAATLTAPTLFTVAQDLTHMQVHAAVDEADIGGVHAGQSATFTVDAFRDQTFRAVVQAVRNAPQTAQNVVTYDVVLDVDNPKLELRPGMTANVLILIVEKTHVTAVPNEALRFRPAAALAIAGSAKPVRDAAAQSAAVYVPDGDSATRVAVRIGATDGNMTEVLGLEPGRKVIVDVARDKSKASPNAGAGRGL